MSTITSLNANDNGATSRGVINTNTTNLNADKLENSSLTGATDKPTPVDADTFPINNSADSNALYKVTWANIKATAKTYFDTLYTAVNTAIPLSYLDTDGTMAANSDTKVASQKAVRTYVDANGFNGANFNAPQGFLLNGKITPTVTSNNITLTLQTMSGATPSAGSPVYCRIGDTVRSITSALSVTKNAGTNWFDSGRTGHATNTIFYTAYLGYNATDGVVLGFARIPYARTYGEFSTTSTNEKYCAISTITNAVSTDRYEPIGAFAAVLGVTATFNWSVPTYDGTNLFQTPMPVLPRMIFTPVLTGVTSPAVDFTYQITDRFFVYDAFLSGTGSTTSFTATLPFAAKKSFSIGGLHYDNGGSRGTVYGKASTAAASTTIDFRTTIADALWTASGSRNVYISWRSEIN